MKKYTNIDAENIFNKRKYTNRSKKIELNAFNWSTLTWCFYMIEKGEELWLMLIIHIISKRNDSVNIILLCTLHDGVFYLLFIILFIYLLIDWLIDLLGSANILMHKMKKSVNDWINSFKNKMFLYSPGFHIHNYLPEGQFGLLSLKIFRTEGISLISSQNHQFMTGL